MGPQGPIGSTRQQGPAGPAAANVELNPFRLTWCLRAHLHGGATATSARIACMRIAVHGFLSGLTHTDEQMRPPGLSTRVNSAVSAAASGQNMYPKRTDTLSNIASLNRRSSALHTVLSIWVTPAHRLVALRCPTSRVKGR